jgi:hypothetical protein
LFNRPIKHRYCNNYEKILNVKDFDSTYVLRNLYRKFSTTCITKDMADLICKNLVTLLIFRSALSDGNACSIEEDRLYGVNIFDHHLITDMYLEHDLIVRNICTEIYGTGGSASNTYLMEKKTTTEQLEPKDIYNQIISERTKNKYNDANIFNLKAELGLNQKYIAIVFILIISLSAAYFFMKEDKVEMIDNCINQEEINNNGENYINQEEINEI